MVELMIVVFVLATLTAVALPQFAEYRDRQRARHCYQAFQVMKGVQAMYWRDFGEYADQKSKLEGVYHPNAEKTVEYVDFSKMEGTTGACESVSVVAAGDIVNNWQALAVPKGSYGDVQGCVLNYTSSLHKVSFNVECTGAKTLEKKDFKDVIN